MRVNGNIAPDSIRIEPYAPVPGTVEVRLTEHVEQIGENLYRYDEYVIHIREREGLREDIEANLPDWLITGRTLEADENASEMADRKEVMDVLGVGNVAQAESKKAAIDAAGVMLTDEQAAAVSELYDEWNPGSVPVYDGSDGEHPQTRVRGRTSGLLYKCRTSHTTQESWPPELTPSLWAVIDAAHAGTIDDPIPASRGMEYEYGKYYLDPEDGKTYLCQRKEESGTITLQYLPHELIGQYFVEVIA